YRPDQTGVRQSGWPRMADLIAANHRLLIFTDHSRSSDESAGLTRDSFGVMYQREWTVENYWSMGSGLGSSDWSCYSRWYGADTNVPLTYTESAFRPLFVMNHFRDAAIASTATTDNIKLADRAQRFCRPAARKKPNFLAVDRYDLGNPTSAVDTLNTYTYP
ncbi:phospholipase, partial [Streptomyces avermitilis]